MIIKDAVLYGSEVWRFKKKKKYYWQWKWIFGDN
jgi:hypothetical protein